jgi:maltose alpha-D-glucosyltransferase/alpha-amylase
VDPRDDRRAEAVAAFARGSFEDLGGSNPAVLAFLREFRGEDERFGAVDETLLCVHNLSRHPQPVELLLGPRFLGRVPVELTGQARFPPIGMAPYLLTLPGYGSYWFRIEPTID